MTSAASAKDCPFCAIAQGNQRSVEVVCEAEAWLAFFPLNPATPGHTLVVPREHVSDLWHASPKLAAALMGGVIRVGQAVESTLAPEGMNLITSAGRAAEQTVFHLHLHIVPRWRTDGFGPIWPAERGHDDVSRKDVAERIRNACRSRRNDRETDARP